MSDDLSQADAKSARNDAKPDDATVLDLAGLKCPLPALKARKALRALPAGGRLRVIATDPMAAIDIPNLVRETGDALEETLSDQGRLIFTVRRKA